MRHRNNNSGSTLHSLIHLNKILTTLFTIKIKSFIILYMSDGHQII